MSTVLLKGDPTLVFQPAIAKRFGLNEAVILQQIHYWLERSKHSVDGMRWVYNDYKEWQKQFPYWSVDTIRRAFRTLEKEGVVKSSMFNKASGDRTKWYTISYETLTQRLDPSVQVATMVSAECTDDDSNLPLSLEQDAPLFNKVSEITSEITSDISKKSASAQELTIEEQPHKKADRISKQPSIDTLRIKAFTAAVEGAGKQVAGRGKMKEVLAELAEIDATPDEIGKAVARALKTYRVDWYSMVALPSAVRSYRGYVANEEAQRVTQPEVKRDESGRELSKTGAPILTLEERRAWYAAREEKAHAQMRAQRDALLAQRAVGAAA